MDLVYCSANQPGFITEQAADYATLQIVIRNRGSVDPSTWLVNDLVQVDKFQDLAVKLSATQLQLLGDNHIKTIYERELSVPLPSNSLLLLVLVGYDAIGEVISERALELRVLPNDSVLALLADYAGSSQASHDVLPLISVERFFSAIELSMLEVKGKNVLVSGCGTGGELLALMEMGASSVTGIEPDNAAFEIGQEIVGPFRGIQLLNNERGLKKRDVYDVIMSRHVLEHVPFDLRNDYMKTLCRHLSDEGNLFIEVPNQDCPIEQHTGLFFFHWLDERRQQEAVRYFEHMFHHNLMDSWTLDSYKRLIGHQNISLEMIERFIEPPHQISHFEYSDTAFANHERSASTLRVWVSKRPH